MKQFRSRIRAYEDRKITGADLSREIFHVAREVNGEEEAILRRSLEGLANRVVVLVERGLVDDVRSEILEVLDEIESELGEWGY